MDGFGEAIFLGMAAIGGLILWVPLIATMVWSHHRSKPTPVIVPVIAQLSGASAFAGMFFGGLAMIGSALCPLLIFFPVSFALGKMNNQSEIMDALLWGAALAGAIALLVFWKFTHKGSDFRRNAALLVFLCCVCAGGLVGANVAAEAKIQHRADELGAICVRTSFFMSSISKAGHEYGRSAHAVAVIDGKRFNWSYKLNDFYPVRDAKHPLTKCPRP